MSICYKKLGHKLREYPLPLKLRFGERALDQISEFEYAYLLKNYCVYVEYRLLRGLTKVDRATHLAAQEKIIQRRQYMLTWAFRRSPHSAIEEEETGVFWEMGEPGIPGSCWRIYGKEYPVWELTGYEYTKYFDYNIVEDKWKEEMMEHDYSPVELELTVVDGPHSLVPWFTNDEIPYGFMSGSYKPIVQCELCGRHFSARAFWPKGYYPKTRAEYDRYNDLDAWNYVNILQGHRACGGPCRDMLTALSHAKLQTKYKNFPLLWIFLGVIDYANYNPDIRRTAENFVRYARSFLESGSHSAGREGNRQVGRQRTEICIN